MNLRTIIRTDPDLGRSRPLRHGLVAGIAVFLLLVGSGASYAYWKATAAVSGVASTATVRLTADGTAAAPLSSEHPSGESKTAPVTIVNTGDVSLVYTASVVATAGWTLTPSSVNLSVWPVASAADCTTASAVGAGAWTGTVAGFTVAPTAMLGAGVSQVLCARTTLSSSVTQAQQGETVTATITFTGSNGWTSSAAVSVSPSVYTVPVPVVRPDTPLCVNAGNGNSDKTIRLTWQDVPNASGYRLDFDPPKSNTTYMSVTSSTALVEGDQWFNMEVGSADGSGTVSIRAIVDGWESSDLVAAVKFVAPSNGNNAKLTCAT